MATQAQIEANRRNAQKSTGPKTDSGKATVAQNALKHGLRASRTLIPTDDPDEFEAHRQSLLDEYQPVGTMEIVLTDRIAALTWQLARAARIQSGTISALTTDRQKEQLKKALDLQGGYYGGVSDEILEKLGISDKEYKAEMRSYKKKQAFYERVREMLKERYYQEIQEVGPYRHDDMELGRIAYRDFSNTRVLERMSMYERRIESCLYRTTQELSRLQTRRIAKEQKSQAIKNVNSHRNVIPSQAGIHSGD